MALPGWLKESVRPYYLRWLYFPLRPGSRPAGFRDCWRYPYRRLEAAGPLLGDAGSPSVVFYPMTDWHTRIQRTQHLARAFARRGFRCLYVSPHLGREFESVRAFDPAHRLSELEPNIQELHVRLPREPVFHDRLLTPGEEEIVARAVDRVLGPAAKQVLQLVSFPLWSGVARRFRASRGFPVVYDCHDLLSGFRNVSREIVAAEADLVREADLVLFSSDGLRERWPGTRESLVVRNGVTASYFSSAPPAPQSPPVAGYVGALDSWFDIVAVEAAAAAHPGTRFVLAGRVEFEPVRRLSRLPNVELPGEIPYERVPELLATFQVGLIPFRINDLTLMTNPIKLYEYFSRGMPVVTTALPEAAAMGELVYVASDPGGFALQVGAALREDDPIRRAVRQEVAGRESWDSRAADILRQASGFFPAAASQAP